MVNVLRSTLATVFRLLRIRPSSQDLQDAERQVRRTLPTNFAAIAVNGLFFPTAGHIVAAGLLLTWFVSELTESAFWVGLIIPIQYGLSLIAQPLVADWFSGRSRRHRFYTYQALVRGVAWIVLAAAAFLLRTDAPALLLAIFFGVIIVDAVAAGVGNIAFSDTLARVIPRLLRGRVRGWRGVFGGIMAAIVGILLGTAVTESSGVSVYGILFALTGILYALGGLVFGLIIVEETDEEQKTRPKPGEILARIRDMWGSETFRRFVIVESALIPLVQGLPFFTLLAKRRFGLDLDTLGVLILVSAITPIVANYFFGRLADSASNQLALLVAAIVGLAAPVCAGLLFAFDQPTALVYVLLGVIVFAVIASSAGVDLTTKNYVLDLAPNADERPFYIGVNDTLIGLPTILLTATGLLVDSFGFAPAFVGIALLALIGVVLSIRLPSPAQLETIENP
jgi:MFS family permease